MSHAKHELGLGQNPTRSSGLPPSGYRLVPEAVPQQLIDGIAALWPVIAGAGERHALALPVLGDCIRDAVATARTHPEIAAIVPATWHLVSAILFDKRAERAWRVPWHRDTWLPLAALPGLRPLRTATKEDALHGEATWEDLDEVLALRLSIDASTDDNGSLRVVPGSHRQRDAEGPSALHAAMTLCVPRGGVLVLSPRLLHASSPPRTKAPRRIVHAVLVSPRLAS